MDSVKDLYLLHPLSKECDAELFATHRAAQRLRELQQEEGQNSRFRIRVDSGGCAGFQYHFHFDTAMNEEDITFGAYDLEFIVDEISLALLNGVILDYVEDMMSASFQLKNPNASSSCGCGSSFSL